MEIVTSDERLRGLFDCGVGLIFNDFEGDHPTKSSMDSNKLRQASCPECDPRRYHSAMTVKEDLVRVV